MTDESLPYRACTICVNLPLRRTKVLQSGIVVETGSHHTMAVTDANFPRAVWVASVVQAPGHRPTQFFCCPAHKDEKLAREFVGEWREETEVSFELYSDLWKRIVEDANANEAIAALRSIPKGDL